jgi:hypothetical protein
MIHQEIQAALAANSEAYANLADTYKKLEAIADQIQAAMDKNMGKRAELNKQYGLLKRLLTTEEAAA